MKIDQIIKLVTNPVNAASIKEGINLQDEHKVHITGEGYDKRLKQLVGYENARDFGYKKELSKPITKYIYELIMDEQNRWVNSECNKSYVWNGSGKGINNTEEFDQYLDTVWKNQSIDVFVRDFLKDALYSEFNGFAFVERTPVTEDETGKKPGQPYIIFIPIGQVRDFKSNGNTIEYLCYYMDDKNKKVRFIDNENDYVFVNKGGKWVEDIENPVIINELGYVPAVQISTKVKNLLIDEVKTSYVDKSIPIADIFLTFYCEYIITCILHAHPILYGIGMRCTYEEKDTGRKCENGVIGMDDLGHELQCPQCKGRGFMLPRDSSEVYAMPQNDKDGKPWPANPPAGYIQSPVETIVDQRENLNWNEIKIYRSTLGQQDYTQESINKTATELVINSKSLENKNNNILANIEYVETFLIDTIGKYLYGETYLSCRVKYSRQFNLKNETILLDEIQKALTANSPMALIYKLGEELISTRYSNNPEVMNRMLVLFKLEPYPFISADSIKDPKEQDFKMNFMDYVNELEDEKKKTIEMIYGEIGYKKTLAELLRIQSAYFTAPVPEVASPVDNNRSPVDQTNDNQD